MDLPNVNKGAPSAPPWNMLEVKETPSGRGEAVAR